MKMNKKELAKFLVDNFTNEFDILDLTGLDFREYDVTVDISCMQTSSDLIQKKHIVGGNLQQDEQVVGCDLIQDEQVVKGTLYQSNQNAKEILQAYQHTNMIISHKPLEDEKMLDSKNYYLIIKKENNNDN